MRLKEEVPKSLFFSSPRLSSVSKIISRHILVAEDHLINQKIMKKLLEQRKHTCDFANNGSEAVRMWGERNYDIILMDMIMPLMCGFCSDSVRTLLTPCPSEEITSDRTPCGRFKDSD